MMPEKDWWESVRYMDWARILAFVTGLVDQELLARNEYLAAENRILKARLNGRLRLSDAERATLGEIGHRLGRKALAEAANVAPPDTILAWYRKLITRKFDGSQARRGRGGASDQPRGRASDRPHGPIRCVSSWRRASIRQGQSLTDFLPPVKTAGSFDQQAAAVRELHVHGNGHALELYGFCASGFERDTAAGPPSAQTELVSRQAQALAEHSKMLGESVARGASEMGKFTSQGLAEASRRSEAA
jgi:hypothetical protein